MLATPKLICETSQRASLEELLPHWRAVPHYRQALTDCRLVAADCFKQLPLLTKPELRANFPANFLRDGRTVEGLLENNLIEQEHTSGTTGDRLPVLFARGWWDEQELRALRLNRFVASALDEFPDARRATITSPACNGLTCPTVWMSREQRVIGRALFVNLARIPFLLSDAELARMAAEVAE